VTFADLEQGKDVAGVHKACALLLNAIPIIYPDKNANKVGNFK
jgi:hypothetical protein